LKAALLKSEELKGSVGSNPTRSAKKSQIMTEEEKRITIAEACGWKIVKQKNSEGVKWVGPNGESAENEWRIYGFGFDNKPHVNDLPDYFKDLNAIQNAIEQLSKQKKYQLVKHNFKCILGNHYSDYTDMNSYGDDGYFNAILAPANVRAEALYMVIKKA
jgi:hypothetical protein